MTNNTRRTALIAGAAIVLVGGWAIFRPELLFINQRVNEAFPTSAMSSSAMPTNDATGKPAGMGQGMAMADDRVLTSGMFHGVAHETKGTATIHQLADGRRVLRLTGFETSNGPDVRVLLVAAKDATDSDSVKSAGYVEVAPLKGNIGDQNYDLPADLDLGTYGAVTVWCNRFNVNFGTAPLAAPMSGDVVLSSGMFHGVAHETKGTATIHRLADGRRVLRLTGFETSNGPDVRVLLVAAKDAKDSDSVKSAGYVEVAPLKGNIGDQNYDLPADLDLGKYGAVTVWCNRFNVNFGTAPLS